jgi:hypothetical protein
MDLAIVLEKHAQENLLCVHLFCHDLLNVHMFKALIDPEGGE